MLFLDSSDPKEIADLSAWGVISGVTTNPLIISREAPGCDLHARIEAICAASFGPVSVELTETEAGAMLLEAVKYRAWSPSRIVIKVPVTDVGLRVIRSLSVSSVETNATCIVTANQAILAALAGAKFVSIFWGRAGDNGADPGAVVSATRRLLDSEGLPAKIIVGSIRSQRDVTEALLAGAHIVTVPPKILRGMVDNAMTRQTIAEFDAAWQKTRAN
jgi:transaldolase